MVAGKRFLIIFLFLNLSIAAQDRELPFARPPKLEHLFSDQFEGDSRGDYEVSGKKGTVGWGKGRLTLGDGAVLQRKLNAGSWVEMELDLGFPKLKRDGQSSELKVWLNLEGATDSFVRFRQKRENGKISFSVSLADHHANWDVPVDQKTKIVKSIQASGDIPSGVWKIRYRVGQWSLIGPRPKLRLIGNCTKYYATVEQVVTTVSGLPHQVNSIRLQRTNRPRDVDDPHARDMIKKADDWEQKMFQSYDPAKLSELIELGSRIRNVREKYLGKFHFDYAVTLSWLGFYHRESGNFEEAEKLIREVISIRKKTLGKDHYYITINILNLASHYKENGHLAKAEPLFLELVSIRKSIFGEMHPNYADALSRLGLLYWEKAEYGKAGPLYLEAKAIFEKTLGKENIDYASVLNNLGGLYDSQGDYDQGESYYRRALDVTQRIRGKDHTLFSALVRTNLASCYISKGLYSKALELAREAESIYKKRLGDNDSRYARALVILAGCYHKLGELGKAEPLFLKAITIQERTLGKEHPDCENSFNSLGLLYSKVGDREKAKQCYLKALAINKKTFGMQHPDYANNLHNLASVYAQDGEYEKAVSLYMESKSIIERFLGTEHQKYASSLSQLGLLYRTMGQYEKAEPLLLEAVAIRKLSLGEEHPAYALALNNLGCIYESLGRKKESGELFLRSKDIFERVVGKQHWHYANSLLNLAKYYRSIGEHEKAEPLLAETLRISLERFDEYAVLQNEIQERKYRERISWEFSALVSSSLKLENRAPSVWAHAIRCKGISLLKEKRNLLLSTHPQTRDLFGELKQVRSQRIKLLNSDPTAEGWKKNRKKLTEKEELIEKQLAQKVANLKLDLPGVSTGELRIPPGACLVDFRKFSHQQQNPKRPGKLRVTPHYLAIIQKSDQSITMVDLGVADKIESAIQRWRRPIEQANTLRRPIDRNSEASMNKAASDLKQLLWDPVARNFGPNELVIVSPDSIVGQFPLAVLPGSQTGKYLIEERKIVSLPVPIMLSKLFSKQPKVLDSSSSTLLVGGIDYGNAEELPKNSQQLAFRNRSLLGETTFPFLEGTKAEISSVHRLIGGSKTLVGTEATERAFKRQAGEHAILHIATHGFFRSPKQFLTSTSENEITGASAMEEQRLEMIENPSLLSGLAFANANNARNMKSDSSENDGILYSAELAMLSLENVELAVLSACDTGVGAEEVSGEGLIGIQRAFQVAGAKSVIASYWKVDDRATQLLMNKYYENLLKYSKKVDSEKLKNNQTTIRIDALRDAQLWMLNNPIVASSTSRGDPVEIDPAKIRKAESSFTPSGETRRTHPRYWAAFMLSGDWR